MNVVFQWNDPTAETGYVRIEMNISWLDLSAGTGFTDAALNEMGHALEDMLSNVTGEAPVLDSITITDISRAVTVTP